MAGLDLAEFIESVCLACDESKLVTSYNVRIQDNTTHMATRVRSPYKLGAGCFYLPQCHEW